ncbi:MAG: putative enzyme [Promethearchaeota archaeon]|nr:MAG: putative enzyme [Candidatus Lokiarchaeota archaeon]
MKIGVISDTHDHMGNIAKIVSILNQRNVEGLIHLGDYISPFTFRVFDDLNEKIKENFYGVWGNNDGDRINLSKNLGQICEFVGIDLISKFDGKKIYATHILSEEVVDALAKSEEFDIILYGHTHASSVNKLENGKLIVNPGEVCGYLSEEPSFAIIDTEKLDAEIIRL